MKDSDEVIKELRKSIRGKEQTLAEYFNEISKVQNSKESELRKMSLQFENEKGTLLESYENLLNDLREQSDAQRVDLEQVAEQLREVQKREKEEKCWIKALEKEKKSLRNELNEVNERSLREKRLTEAVVKNAVIHARKESEQMLEEVKKKFNDEKSRLFAWAVDEFREFFNAGETFDEKSYRALLDRARNEMKRLVASDLAVRRLVGAEIGLATEDAVARFVLC
jgi:hypothetical protein